MKLLILGGDDRLKYAAAKLVKYHDVYTYGLSAQDMLPDGKCDAAVLGLPASRDGININAPLCDRAIPITSLASFVKPGGIVMGGLVGVPLQRYCGENFLLCEDYYRDEAVMLKNAVPSAEGALAAGINATPVQMLGQNVLVLGFGRIASLLARYLVALRCNVTVAARSREKRVQAQTLGCRAVGFESLCNILPSVTLIYNTVPCAVLHDREIDAMSDDCLYIELASASGINKDSMAKIRTRVINAQGLPSKTAPKTAGEILADSVLDILNNYDEGGGSNDNRT